MIQLQMSNVSTREFASIANQPVKINGSTYRLVKFNEDAWNGFGEYFTFTPDMTTTLNEIHVNETVRIVEADGIVRQGVVEWLESGTLIVRIVSY